MRKLLVSFDEEVSNLLAKQPNQNEFVRNAVKLYIGDISPDTLKGLREAYAQIQKSLKEIDSKIDYIAREIK